MILWLLPPVPEKVKWGFSAREKEIAKNRTAEAYNVEDAKINPQHLIQLFKDPKIYFFGKLIGSIVGFACKRPPS